MRATAGPEKKTHAFSELERGTAIDDETGHALVGHFPRAPTPSTKSRLSVVARRSV